MVFTRKRKIQQNDSSKWHFHLRSALRLYSQQNCASPNNGTRTIQFRIRHIRKQRGFGNNNTIDQEQ